ncbi:hypothetical protein ACEU07_05410 [Chromobacterium violaceum]|uniref:hypothetical protein n=1 Tax=Chromobacterium violaceum TaxID=536 RepID=UPI0035A6F974
MFVFLLMTFVLFADNSRPEQNLVNLPVKKNTFSALQPEEFIDKSNMKSFKINQIKPVTQRYIFAGPARPTSATGKMPGQTGGVAAQERGLRTIEWENLRFRTATSICMHYSRLPENEKLRK